MTVLIFPTAVIPKGFDMAVEEFSEEVVILDDDRMGVSWEETLLWDTMVELAYGGFVG